MCRYKLFVQMDSKLFFVNKNVYWKQPNRPYRHSVREVIDLAVQHDATPQLWGDVGEAGGVLEER